jgi:hypothetical protein
VVRALSALPRVRVTFVARATSGACAAQPADSLALGPLVTIREAAPTSPEFARLLALPHTALLLPLAFFATCSGSGANASSEDYSLAAAALRSSATRSSPPPPLAVFAFDAQAFRLQALARHEPNAAQAARHAAAAAAEGAREAALYGRADVFAMLTAEDLASISPAWTRPGTPRLVVGFRDEVDARLGSEGGSGVPPPLARALRLRATLPPFAARAGFAFMGSGNNPTNVLALHYFLRRVWPALRARLPGAQLHIIGAPPSRACKEHGVWCGWLAGTEYDGGGGAPEASGITVHGLVADPRSVLAGVRVALAPLVCGTGINTKTGYYLAQGVPVVGTEKGIRGYGDAAGLAGGGGYSALGMEEGAEGAAMAAECARLHEGQEAWEAASLGALERTARLEDERARGEDLQELVRALREGLER